MAQEESKGTNPEPVRNAGGNIGDDVRDGDAAAQVGARTAVGVQDSAPAAATAQEKIAGMDRRTFFTGIGGAAVLLGMGGFKLTTQKSKVRPPGGQDEARLLATCIRCEKCLTICPHDIISPSHIEDGVVGMRTPQLNFDLAYCDWCQDANGGVPLCTTVCPTSALQLEPGQTRDTLPIGVPELKIEECLGWRLAGCRFCYDACDYDAIVLDDFNRPELVLDNCIGCGACETVCVSLQNGSIREGAVERAIKIRPLGSEGGLVA